MKLGELLGKIAAGDRLDGAELDALRRLGNELQLSANHVSALWPDGSLNLGIARAERISATWQDTDAIYLAAQATSVGGTWSQLPFSSGTVRQYGNVFVRDNAIVFPQYANRHIWSVHWTWIMQDDAPWGAEDRMYIRGVGAGNWKPGFFFNTVNTYMEPVTGGYSSTGSSAGFIRPDPETGGGAEHTMSVEVAQDSGHTIDLVSVELAIWRIT